MKIFAILGSMLVAFIILDLSWTGGVAKGFYDRHIGHFFAERVSLIPIVFFYLLYISGLYYFVVSPGLAQQSTLWSVAISGAFFGLIAYGTYDLVNQGLFKSWPIIVTVIDMTWGTTLTGVISVIGVFVGRMFA